MHPAAHTSEDIPQAPFSIISGEMYLKNKI